MYREHEHSTVREFWDALKTILISTAFRNFILLQKRDPNQLQVAKTKNVIKWKK